MSEILNRLARDWPDRHAPFKDDFATDAKSLRAWLNHLPLANPAATSRQLLDALIATNQLRIDPQQRLEALEILRAPVEQVVGTLDRQILSENLPLPPAKVPLAQMVRDFEHDLAVGYSQALYDLCVPSGKVPFLKGKSVALAATRALQHFGRVLEKAYVLYHAPPAGIWLHLHEVFLAACLLRIDDKSCPDPLLEGAEFSPRHAYAHVLLLALSNPYRYNQREMADVFSLTRAWAPYCLIVDGAAQGNAFAVRTDVDQGLGYVPEEREAAIAGLLAFDPHPVQHMIAGHIGLLPPGMDLLTFKLKGGPSIQSRHHVVDRLVKSWGGSAERGHARLAAGHLLDSVIGLHGVHFVLAGNEDFDSFLRRVRGQAISLSEREMVATWANGGNDTKPSVQRAKVLDQSLGGYRLVWEHGDVQRAKVGELVGLAQPAEDGEDQDWMVGAIRWIRIGATGTLDAGVELLARRAQPVGVASFDDYGTVRAPMRGVLLLDQDDGESLTVLAPQMFDNRAHELELTRPADPLDWQSEAMVGRLDRVSVMDASGAYQCVVIGPAANVDEDNPGGDDARLRAHFGNGSHLSAMG